MYVALRRYGDALKSRPNLKLFDYILELSRGDLRLKELSSGWLEYYLFARDAILLLDGLDELPDAKFKREVRKKVGDLLDEYPGNTTIMSSRIVGYEKEVRYDGLGFAHHRVARLRQDDIQKFVGNWYAARIDSAADRDRHVADLVGIVSDPSNTAIRELAENPLLLTIISLVHRIDAVLPDQRVVLYQKCTETLLNTWHTWKFRPEHATVRPKAEKHNTARMEAVAYWMQCLMDATAKQERSVVRFDDLKDFLAKFIVQNEKQTAAAADEMAGEFLTFIKERAGLLIEVGEGQYSFLHLTFQEYLAATYLRKSGEVGGVKVIWDRIHSGRRYANPRWHEVIRLLIGSLDQEESQAFLLKRLLPAPDDEHLQQRAIVVGGLPGGQHRSGVTFGLLDTGVDASHPDLEGRIKKWAEFDSKGQKVTGSEAHDSDEHGTHCAGTISGGNASGRFIGMAPEVKIAAALVLNGEQGGTDAQVLAGIDWAVEAGVDVLSMSLGGLVMDAETPSTYTEAILSCIEAGIPVVAAIGNEGHQTTGSPGNELVRAQCWGDRPAAPCGRLLRGTHADHSGERIHRPQVPASPVFKA